MHLLTAKRWPSTLRSLTGLWLVAFLTFGPTLAAATLTVDDDGPADFSSITAALAVATSGDIIAVAAGLYDESRETFPLELKDGVQIIGAGRDSTTILASFDTPAFSNQGSPLGPTTRLEGFELTQASGSDQILMEFFTEDATMSPVITANRFLGNTDEFDGGVALISNGLGGMFDGSITGNDFFSFATGGGAGAGLSLSGKGPTVSGGGVLMGRLIGGPPPDAIRSNGVTPSGPLPVDEDRITPTISGNTFEGNAFAVAVIGTNYYDCGCETSGVLSPVIDDNELTENGLDVLLIYGGFGFREFTPTITNNTSTDSAISIAGLPYFYSSSTAPASAAKGVSSSSVIERFRQIKANMDEGRVGKARVAAKSKRATSSKRATRPTGIAPEDPSALYDVTITGNTITNPLFAGMLFYQYMYTTESVTISTEISENQVTGDGGVGGIIFGAFVDELTTQIPGALQFERNTVTGVEDSMVVFLGSDFVTAKKPGVKLAEAVANDIQIVGNVLQDGLTGLLFVSNGYTTLAPLAACNVITGHSETGVFIDESSDPNPDFGGGARSSPGENSIHDNEVDMDNFDTDEVKAENNYWGTTDGPTIDANTTGLIDFTPFLSAEPVCSIVVTGSADLELAKTVTSTGSYFVGSNITYQLTVTNNGPDAATNVVITDPIPAGTEFLSASAGCTDSPTTITCTAATLALDASQSFDITLRATDEGVVINTASVDSADDDPTPANDDASAPAVTVGAAPAHLAIPTASEWGLVLLGIMLAFVGMWFSRRS